MTVTERRFDIDGLCVAAREWGDGGQPVIALHGWLDNAASFDALGEALSGCHILALDLPGHGHSDHKPPHATYQIWDDLLIILAVADVLGWERFVLLGHSRGAIMSTLLAAACPPRISALICLDGLAPSPVRAEDAPQQLGRFLRDYRRLPDREPRRFASIDDIVAARQRAIGTGDASARKIAERAAIANGDGFIWNCDPRLKAASAFKLTEAHIHAMLRSLAMPVLVLVAEQGMGQYLALDGLLPLIKDCTVQRLPGSHHFHMEEAAPAIAECILTFLPME